MVFLIYNYGTLPHSMQSGKGRDREMELMAILDRTGSNGGPGEGPDNHIDEVQIGNGKYF